MRRILLVGSIFVLASCGLSAQAQTLRLALRQDPDILDPTLARSYVGRIVFAGLCDKLFDIDGKLNIVPQLATGHEWADPKTLVIKLRSGVKFHNGEMLDADAVKYSLERHLTLQGSFRRSEIGAIDQVEIVDPLTVRLKLKAPSVPILAQLADRAGMILPPKATEAAGKDFGANPVCSGPFRFVERVAQDHITLERFPEYWNAQAIHLQRVTYLSLTDSSVRVANLRAGGIDLAEQITPNDVEQVKADPKLRIVSSPGLGYQGLTFNLANGPRSQGPIGQKALLRQAFELAIDRTALIQVVFNGMYRPTAQAVPFGSPYYVAAVQPPARDIAKAKELVKQAGVPTPIVVTMNVTNEPENRQQAEVIQSMVTEAGFNLKLNTMEFASSLQAEARGDYEVYQIGWSGRADPDGNTYPFLHTGGGQNTGHYSNAVVDAALDDARAVADVEQRGVLYAKLWQQERQDLPIIYIYQWQNIVGMSAKVTGFTPVADGLIRLQGVSLAP
jgi:peptide/nickel transport system substrate-binding protein